MVKKQLEMKADDGEHWAIVLASKEEMRKCSAIVEMEAILLN